MAAIIPILAVLFALALISNVRLLWKLRATRKEMTLLTGKARMMAGTRPGQETPQTPEDNVADLDDALKQLEERLRTLGDDLNKEKERTAAILSTISAGILLLSTERIIIMLNDTARKLFKVSGENIIGKPFIDLTRDHEMEAVVQRCLETKQKQTGQVQTPIGKQYFEITATPLSNGALVLVQDLTNVRRLEKTRQDFIVNISHELRTPIASIKAIVETLQNGAIKDKNAAKDFLQRMHIEVDKLAQMVNELVELSRIESGEMPLRLGPVDMTEILKRVTERLKAQADRAQLSMNLEISAGLPAITADGNRIEQVLVNLIHNAIKFTPPNGKIVISAGLKGGNVVVSVSDTGIGIPSDDLNRIFERFYKVDKARSGGGTGLGLAIAKHIVQEHGGTIWVESEEGKGSTFYFALPA